MNENEKQALAELGGYPGFRLLVELFKQHELGLAQDVALAVHDNETLFAARRYQTFRYVREFLEAQPLIAEEALVELRTKQEAWDSVPATIDEVLHSRFGRNFHEEGDERA